MIKNPPIKKKRAEKSTAKHSELENPKMLKEIIDNSRIGILRTTVDGRLIFCNSTLISLFGYESFEEIKNIDIASDLYKNPKDRLKLIKKLQKYGIVEQEELLLITKDKKEIPVVFTLRAKFKKNKEIKHIDGYLEDITILKKNERKINVINEQLEILAKINNSLSQTLDLDELLDKCLKIILPQFSDTELGGVLYLAEDYWLVPEAVCPQSIGNLFFPVRINSKSEYANFSSLAYTKRKEFIINNTHDKKIIKKFSAFLKDKAHSFAIFPVVLGKECLGVINIFSNNTNYFNEDIVEFFKRIFAQLAVYIHNASDYRETNYKIIQSRKKNEEINLSYDISKRLSAHLEFDKIISECFSILKEQKFTSAKIYLTSEDGNYLDLLSSFTDGSEIPLERIELGKWFSGLAVKNRFPVIINDSHSEEALSIDPELIDRKKHSFIALPIFLGDKCLGCITISSDKPNTFRKSVVSFCDTISSQLSFVLNNAIQHSNIVRKNNELVQQYNALNRLSKHIELKDIINEAFEIFKEMGFVCGKIYKISDDKEYIELVSSYDLTGGAALEKMRIGEYFSGKAAEKLLPVIVNDTHDEEVLSEHKLYGNLDQHSFASFPLVYDDKCIGVLNLVHKEINRFKPEVLNLCINIVKQLAFLINNSKIHDTTVKRHNEITLLYDVTKRLSAYISLNEIITECFKFFRELDISDGKVFLEKNSNLELFAFYSSSKVIPGLPKDISEGKYFTQIAFDDDRPLIVNSSYNEEIKNIWPEMQNFNELSFAVFPIKYGEKKLGVINLACDHPNYFDEFTVNLITNIVYHLGVMINNSRLFEEVVKKNKDLKLLNELSRDLNQRMNLFEGSKIITKKLEEIFEYEGFFIDLYDSKNNTMSNVINVDLIDGEKQYFKGEQNRTVISPLIREIIATRKPYLLLRENDQEKIFGLIPFGDTRKRALSLMYSPLSTENEILGVIAVHSYKKNAYNDEDLELLTGVGNYISVIIKNILLYKSLSDSENRYKILVENAPEAIYSFDKNGRFTAANFKTYEFLNTDRDKLIGQPVADFLPEEIKSYFLNNVNDALLRKEPFSFEIKMADDKYFQNSVMPIIEDDNKFEYFVGITRDITSQKESEENNIRIQQQLSENKKHEFVVSMTRNIAHVFNNVLVNVLSRSSFAKTLVEKDSIVYPHLEKIEVSSKRVGELVKQLLIFAQSGNYFTESIDLNKIIQFYYCSKKPQIKNDIDFNVDLSKSNPVVISNRDQIIVMLDKLFINSLESIVDKGRITITSGITKISEQKLVGSQRIDPGVYGKFSVLDNGTGIRDDVKNRFFEPFNTTKEYGRGLGLPSVFGIVMNMNGFININSEIDKGTEVEIYLPLKI